MERVFGVGHRAQDDHRRAPATMPVAPRHIVMRRHPQSVDAFRGTWAGPPAPVAWDLPIKGRFDRVSLAHAGHARVGQEALYDGDAAVQFLERSGANRDREIMR